jgi:S1-C subfamily serine protease
MTNPSSSPIETAGDLLVALSDDLAAAVEHAAATTVTVHGRRRLPGSGILWDEDGLVVTASHTVEREDDLTVTLPDGRTVAATFAGRDAASDVALLHIDRPGLPAAVRAKAPVRPGHLVLAIGRPGPSGPMASFGVVSHLGGPLRGQRGVILESYIHADVGMLPGFSGGPLVTSAGETLGLNSSQLGRNGGLTIPNEEIDRIVLSLRDHGRVKRGVLGIGAQSIRVPLAVRDAAGGQEHALLVVSMEEDGAAERAGMLLGDILLTIAGSPMASVDQVQERLVGEFVGIEVPVFVLRGGAPLTLSVFIEERA